MLDQQLARPEEGLLEEEKEAEVEVAEDNNFEYSEMTKTGQKLHVLIDIDIIKCNKLKINYIDMKIQKKKTTTLTDWLNNSLQFLPSLPIFCD